mgnify:CR=1 FL=1
MSIMKAIYLKPEVNIVKLSSSAIMISASGNGESILGDGGNASEKNITSSDSRGGFWDDED